MWNKQTAALFPLHYTEIYSVRVSEKNSKIHSSRKCSISLQLMLSQRDTSCSFRKLFSFLGGNFCKWFRLIGFTANLFLLASLRKVLNHFSMRQHRYRWRRLTKNVVNIIVSVNKTSKVKNVNRGCPWLFSPSQIFSTGRSWSNPF